MSTEIERGRWYPNMPPALPGETDEQYTNRLTGADRTDRVPYDHSRNRQCSIGYHEECSDRHNTGECGCPCHEERRAAHALVTRWNERHPVSAQVTFPQSPDEPPTVTTSAAYPKEFFQFGVEMYWPVVELDGFEHPVKLSWLAPATDVP